MHRRASTTHCAGAQIKSIGNCITATHASPSHNSACGTANAALCKAAVANTLHLDSRQHVQCSSCEVQIQAQSDTHICDNDRLLHHNCRYHRCVNRCGRQHDGIINRRPLINTITRGAEPAVALRVARHRCLGGSVVRLIRVEVICQRRCRRCGSRRCGPWRP